MFTLDPRIRGIPAQREQVIGVFESVNQPHLAIPGKQAGLARAYIVGLRGAAGLGIFVYLHLLQSNDCAVYLSERRTVQPKDYPAEEAAAVSFVESMGFIVDNLNFENQSRARQEELIRSLPVFHREPKAATSSKGQEPSSLSNLARLLGSF